MGSECPSVSGSLPQPRSDGLRKPPREKAFLPNLWVCDLKPSFERSRRYFGVNEKGWVEMEGKQVY